MGGLLNVLMRWKKVELQAVVEVFLHSGRVLAV